MNDNAEGKDRPRVELEAYKDIAQPTARVVGSALGKVVGLTLDWIGALADIGNANLMRFVKKLEKEERENPENIIPTKPSVAVPILEKMRYVEEDALAEAYAELLKNSCLKDRQAKVLPAYSEILARLSSDEVKILDCIKRQKICYTSQELLENMSKEDQLEWSQTERPVFYWYDGFPFLEIRDQQSHQIKEWTTIAPYFTDIHERVDISSHENIDAYIDNLKSLGIFTVPHDSILKPDAIYRNLEIRAARQYKGRIERENRVMVLVKKSIKLTPLAQSFLAMCTSSQYNRESNAPPA